MARAPKMANPVDEFMRKVPELWRHAYYSAAKPFSRLVSENCIKEMKQTVSDITGISAFSDLAGISIITNALESSLTGYLNGKDTMERSLRLRKNSKGYTFSMISNRESAQLVFSSLNNSLPGRYDILQKNPNATVRDQLAPLIAGLKFAGFNIPDKLPEGLSTIDLDPRILDRENDDAGPLMSDSSMISAPFNHIFPPYLSLKSAVYTLRMGAYMNVDTSIPTAIDIIMEPFAEITITDAVFETMVDSSDASGKPFLGLSWMKSALHSGLSSRVMRRWDTSPATDLRETSKLLNNVKKQHGKARARVNENLFCIADNGIPMFIPELDDTDRFMVAVAKPEVDDEGYFSFDDNLAEWGNRILLVDWFNDVIVYTLSDGSIRYEFLYGYVPLDRASEYAYLNLAISDKYRVLPAIRDLSNLMGALVRPEEAQQFLSQDYRKPDSFMGGKIDMSFNEILSRLAASTDKVNPNDPGFKHSTEYSVLLKHLLGIELEELKTENVRGMCAHVHAYIQALNSKKGELILPVISRLQGFEYILRTSTLTGKYDKIKAAALEKRALLQPVPNLDVIDIPNVDTDNLKGVMPHQVRILSQRFAGVVDGAVAAAPGAGKTVMIMADILKKKELHPEWKPLVITKSRLVKGFISEINFFTKGKVNVMPLRSRTIKRLIKQYKLNTFEKFMTYIKGLPNNTIFIAGYTDLRSRSKFFRDLVVPSRVFMQDVGLPQFLHILRLIGFEQVQCDESHLVKNMKSLQSQYACTIMAQAEEKVIASGTQITNTALDLLGQGFAINPMIYGKSLELFKEEYDITAGIITDEAAGKLRLRMKRFLQESTAYKEDWAFVLPDLVDRVITTNMTEHQVDFYNRILAEAMAELKARMEGKKIPSDSEPKDPKDSDDDSDDDDDDDLEEDEPDEDEDEESSFMQKLDRSLAKVEQFVVAPDSNEQFMQTVGITQADMISPYVAMVDGHLDRIYANKTENHKNNKTAVFGIHKVASVHFMKHSRYKDRMVHYSAGNDEAIRKFKTVDDIWILCADSTGLREGENLQMLSHIFDLQAVWSPGDYEQLVSRMYRPDPKGVYNKDKVYHYWCTVSLPGSRPGVNTIKLARMISKSVSAARYKYDGDPRWRPVARELDDLGMLTMSFKFLEGAIDDDLAPYLAGWERFVEWETGLNADNRRKVAEELEIENPGVRLLDPNGVVLDRNLFTKLAMREVKSTKTIRGSKKAFVPWDFGTIPADPYGLGLNVLGTQKIELGTPVWTEFGPGICMTPDRKKRITVELSGLRKFSVHRQSVSISGSEEGKKKLQAIIANPSAWKAETMGPIEILPKLDPESSMAPKGSSRVKKQAVVAPPAKPPTLKDGTGKPPKTALKPPTIKKPKVPAIPRVEQIEEIYTYLINGFPALVIMDPPDRIYDLDWTEVNDFVTISFRNWAIVEKFLDAMANKFYLSNKDHDQLIEEMEQMRTGKAVKLNKQVPNSVVRSFFLTQHGRPKTSKQGKDVVKPYWLSVSGDIKLAFSKSAHSATVVRWLKAMKAKNPSIKQVIETNGFAVRIFESVKEAVDALTEVGKEFDMPQAELRNELRELQQDIKAMRAPARTPTKVAPRKTR